MNLDFNEEQKMFKSMAHDFLVKECTKLLVRELEKDEKGYSPELWKKMAEFGWLGLVIPQQYDGMEMSFLDLVVLLEEMGYVIVPGPFFSTAVVGAYSLMEAGKEEQKKELLPKLSRGELILSLALNEPDGRYGIADTQVKAVAKGNSFVINGTKLFVDNAHVADYLIGVTRTAEGKELLEGISLFLIPTNSSGLTIEVLPTIGGDKLCAVTFQDVVVPIDNLLGLLHKGSPVITGIIEIATIAKCAEMIGGAQAALDMTGAYVKDRIQFGKPIGSFQIIQHYFANMWVSLETGRNLLYKAAWKVSEGIPASFEVAAAKGYINEVYKFITERGVQCHGAIGLTRDHDMGLYYRRAKAAELAFGDTDYHRELVAQQIGL